MFDAFFRKLYPVLCLSLAAGLTADEPMAPSPEECACSETCEMPSFSVWGNFIYWQPIQENMNLGVLSNNSAAMDLVNGHIVDLDYDFHPGFQVGMGYRFCDSIWAASLEYTWFRASESVCKRVDSNNTALALFPAWQIPTFLNSQYDEGKMHWDLDIDFIDLGFSAMCCFCGELEMSPFFGVRAARLDQKVKADYLNFTESDQVYWPSTHVHYSSDSWGIGPRFGLETRWNVCGGFSLVAAQDLDILYTTYDLKVTQYSDVDYASKFVLKQDNAHFLKAHVDLSLGFDWRMGFCSDCYFLTFGAAYSFQVFFDQNTFRSIHSEQTSGKSLMPTGNLYLNGLTATLGVDF